MAIFNRRGATDAGPAAKVGGPDGGAGANGSDSGSIIKEKKPFAQRKPASELRRCRGVQLDALRSLRDYNLVEEVILLIIRRCRTRYLALADTAFKQQRLKAWQPILTPRSVLPTFFILGLIFAPIGAVLYYFSSTVSEL